MTLIAVEASSLVLSRFGQRTHDVTWPLLYEILGQMMKWHPVAHGITPTTVAYDKEQNTLLISPWADDWKWGRARTLYHPSINAIFRVMAENQNELCRYIPLNARVAFGNWASRDIYEYFPHDLGSMLHWKAGSPTHLTIEWPITLYHGTISSLREKITLQEGLIPTNASPRVRGHSRAHKNAVYFSGSATRAQYFAEDHAHRVNKKLTKALEPVYPMIVSIQLPESRWGDLQVDEDYVAVCKTEKSPKPTDGLESLKWFGQVALTNGYTVQEGLIKEVSLPHLL